MVGTDALQSYPAISIPMDAEHDIEDLEGMPEIELVAMIKGYRADVENHKQSFKENIIPGANTHFSTSGNAVETDEARAYLQRTKAAEQEDRGSDLK